MRRLLVLATLVLAGSVGSAQAATINFEDLALDPFGVGGDRTSGGYFFDTALNHAHIDDGTGGWNTSNGSQFMMIDNVTNNPNGITNKTTFSPTTGAPFALNSIDISEAGGVFASPPPNNFTTALQIVVTGNPFGGGIPVSRTLTLDYNPSTNPPFGFQTFTFNSDWDNLASVILEGLGATCCGPTPATRGNYFAIDNIVVETAAVPEPGTLTLLGLGSAYLFGRRRRNRR